MLNINKKVGAAYQKYNAAFFDKSRQISVLNCISANMKRKLSDCSANSMAYGKLI